MLLFLLVSFIRDPTKTSESQLDARHYIGAGERVANSAELLTSETLHSSLGITNCPGQKSSQNCCQQGERDVSLERPVITKLAPDMTRFGSQ